MKLVLNLTGRRLSAEQAAKNKQGGPWRCALCEGAVHVRLSRGTAVVTHLDADRAGCSAEPAASAHLAVARRAAAILGQSWLLSAPVVGADAPDEETRAVTLERVAALNIPACDFPVMAVQSYETAFLVGIVATDEQADALHELGTRLGYGALGVLCREPSWANLTAVFQAGTRENLAWITPVEAQRVDNKRARFNRLVRLSTGATGVTENRQATHYDPRLPENRRQYLQDILSEIRAQRWAKPVRALILCRSQGAGWAEWFEYYPVQLPQLWLRFWLIKNALHTKGRLIDTTALASGLADVWAAADDQDLVGALEQTLREHLYRLEEAGWVRAEGAEFRCVRSLK